MTGELQSEPEQFTGLAFADGSVWAIEAGDETAREIVSRAGAAMQFTTHCGPAHRVLVRVKEGRDDTPSADQGRVVCMLESPSSEDEMAVQLMRFAVFLGIQMRAHGGILLHGALAERSGQGVILAGHGEAGKTTASRRLRPPWRSLCDDECLVVRDARGAYWAHPWPTWSDFLWGGKGGSWPVQQAVPLKAIFSLRQESEDRATPMGSGEAACLLIGASEQVAPPKLWHYTEHTLRESRRQDFDNICALAQNVRTCRLDLTLDGAFWREMDRFLPRADVPPSAADILARFRKVTEPKPGGPFNAFYTGPSMNPTLRQGDLMEVVPYGGQQVRAGDIVFIVQPDKTRDVVHRVVSATPEGIRTRGDNCSRRDPWILEPTDIAGRVVAAWRGMKRRSVAGGRRGLWLARWRRACRCLDLRVSQHLHPVYRAVALRGMWRCLLPHGLRPRVVVFQSNEHRHARLLMGQRMIGAWNPGLGMWHIHRPFRLFVNESDLPGAADIAGDMARGARRSDQERGRQRA